MELATSAPLISSQLAALVPVSLVLLDRSQLPVLLPVTRAHLAAPPVPVRQPVLPVMQALVS